jgi:hypothetical protein
VGGLVTDEVEVDKSPVRLIWAETAQALEERKLRSTEFKVNGRILTPGTEFSVKGVRGRFRFVEYVVSEAGEWVTGYGGDGWRDSKGVMGFRSFAPDQIRRVHWKEKMR